jgi:HSP20 family molecular chaperone IbpA
MSTDITKNDKQSSEATAKPAQRAGAERPSVRPRVDVFENDAEYLVVADLPGVAKDAVEVQFEDGELHLAARREATAGGTMLAEEYRTADFRRAFTMPEGVDAEKIAAELTNGVLRIHLPKSAAKRPRRIEVRAS